jgi:hypothetical protein
MNNTLATPLEHFDYEKESIRLLFDNHYAASMLQYKEHVPHVGSLPLNQELLEKTFPRLCSSIKKITNKGDKFFARFFITIPKSKGSIHIDTANGVKDCFRNWALNIPIANCAGTFHEWYDMHQTPYTVFEHSALYWKNYSSGTLIDKHELTVASILSVSTPHRINNPLNSYRIVLSVRTESDVFNIN